MAKFGVDNLTMVPALKPGSVFQRLSLSTSQVISTTFDTGTTFLRLAADQGCYYRIGPGTLSASAGNGTYLPDGAVEYRAVGKSQRLFVMGSAGSGSIFIEEI